MPTNTLRCSFCGKSQQEVKKLVAGPHAFICNECIELCLDILVVEEGDSSFDPLVKFEMVRKRRKMLADMMRIVRSLLENERERHAPYAALEELFGTYKAATKSKADPVPEISELQTTTPPIP